MSHLFVWLIAGAILPSMLIAWASGFAIRRLAPRLGIVDRPGLRKVHTQPTPLGGGLAIWLGMIVPLAAGQIVLWWLVSQRNAGHPLPIPAFIDVHLNGLMQQSPKLWKLLGAGTVLVILGLIDDLRGLAWQLRLAVQVAVASFIVWQGWQATLFIDLPWLTAALTVCWIVGLVNSFNMLDNMDGLSGGVGVIASLMLVAVLWLAPDPTTNQPQLFVAGFLLVLAGSVLGFLWHNRPTARLFMGDAGSYFIGFCLATATVMATYSGGHWPRYSVLAPLCVLAVPLYDTLTVVWIRLRQGRSPFEGDKNHFSHRLVDLGMTKGQAVLTVYLLTATCGLGALLLHEVSQVGAAIILLLVGCVLTVVGVLETVARRALKGEKLAFGSRSSEVSGQQSGEPDRGA
jgi:UDP-GlcNAc:undecaprenyl-phosphate GlcNAc-1-phosphate transferase